MDKEVPIKLWKSSGHVRIPCPDPNFRSGQDYFSGGLRSPNALVVVVVVVVAVVVVIIIISSIIITTTTTTIIIIIII